MKVSIVRGGGLAGIATRTQLASDALPKAGVRAAGELAAAVAPADRAAARPPRRDALQGRGRRRHRHPHRDDAAGAGARADRLRQRAPGTPGRLELAAAPLGRLERAVRVAAPLRPRAREQAAGAEPGVLDREQVVAGGDARAAVGDDGLGAGDADLGELRAQLARAPGSDRRRRGSRGTGRLCAPGMWPKRGSSVSAAPWKRSRWRASMTTLAVVSAASSIEARRSAGHGRDAEARRRPRRRLRLERAVPGLDPAVEQRGLVAGGAQHPHQPRRHHAAGVVVGHDDVVVADPERRPSRRAKCSGVGQRVAAAGAGSVWAASASSRSTNTAPGQVAGVVGVAARRGRPGRSARRRATAPSGISETTGSITPPPIAEGGVTGGSSRSRTVAAASSPA